MANIRVVFNEVDALRGRLSVILVKYPDTEVRMRPAIKILDVLLTKPDPETIPHAIEELIDLRTYFHTITKRHPDLNPTIDPAVKLIDLLLGPSEVSH